MNSFKKYLKEDSEIYHSMYPSFKGGNITLDKIIKRIKTAHSLTTASSLDKIYATAWKEIRKFNSPKELEDNMYWHGTGGYIFGGLKPGFTQVKKERGGGGGYGESYHTISVSKDKNVASNFTGESRHGTVHPVLLRKGATVKDMTDIEDSIELEDKLIELWKDKVDAVKIGNWDNNSEKEMVILNPRSILLFKGGESFPVYQKKKFENPDIKIYTAIYDTVKNNPIPAYKNGFLQVVF